MSTIRTPTASSTRVSRAWPWAWRSAAHSGGAGGVEAAGRRLCGHHPGLCAGAKLEQYIAAMGVGVRQGQLLRPQCAQLRRGRWTKSCEAPGGLKARGCGAYLGPRTSPFWTARAGRTGAVGGQGRGAKTKNYQTVKYENGRVFVEKTPAVYAILNHKPSLCRAISKPAEHGCGQRSLRRKGAI